jgi:hypothetical protein
MEKSLRELKGQFVKFAERADNVLMFDCPVCERGHSIAVSFTAPSLFGSGAIWSKSSDDIATVTVSPIIDCTGALKLADGREIKSQCKFHGWVRDGKVQW